MTGWMQPSHLIIIAIIFLLLFGAGKLPAAARGLGQSLRIFKSEIREMTKDDGDKDTDAAAQRELPPGEKGEAAADPASEKKSA
ncbi:Sec-independent protein translocase protein TatA/E homolog [Gordonia araii NBRC 100433]|uniref:Sec-independent protein translocase protein TatA n=1 Tax=Gordonia araii NBRC 100433 TaxID=1073574 RepID=G7H0L0_9ACTN|nr:Sec-independent protein translocase subunit TatA [Gordonia araii]NNG96852.1 Sec-independent protein translocase subunit TatA [Gordonia araii NBRC 100433]GAB09385.1 Sec-independent protein translocase protein TatA/E homolog [Gordonia araii NBRC 100433]